MHIGCTYYICSMKEFFKTLELKECGVVLPGNSKTCKVQGMWFIILKMFDNWEVLLQEVRYALQLKINLFPIIIFD